MIDGKQIAKARDDWFNSDEGKTCLYINILKQPEDRYYLKNRLEYAFLAGVEWAEQQLEKEDD